MPRFATARVSGLANRSRCEPDQSDGDRLPDKGRAALTLLAAAGLAVTLVGARGPIVRMAPHSAALYEALGLPVNLARLDIIRASARVLGDGERRLLVVDGEVANSGAETRTVPPMRVSVRSADGQNIYAWTTNPTRQKIQPGERAAFSARLASPPAEGADVVVEFERTNASAGPTAHPAARAAETRRAQGSRTESQ